MKTITILNIKLEVDDSCEYQVVHIVEEPKYKVLVESSTYFLYDLLEPLCKEHNVDFTSLLAELVFKDMNKYVEFV